MAHAATTVPKTLKKDDPPGAFAAPFCGGPSAAAADDIKRQAIGESIAEEKGNLFNKADRIRSPLARESTTSPKTEQFKGSIS